MCLIAVAWRVHPQFPLVIAANRDEFFTRAALPVHQWEDDDRIIGGRDLQAGGTWLAATRHGRIAAVTNVRQPETGAGAWRSRGELPVEFLAGDQSPTEFAARLEPRADQYRGYNLLLVTADQLVLTSNRCNGPLPLDHGIHAISNAPPGVDWPKTRRAREILGAALAARGTTEELAAAAFALLADATPAASHELPDNGLPAVSESRLSAIFVTGDDYGTRCSSLLLLDAQGELTCIERRFGPGGAHDGETRLHVRFGG